MKGKPDCSELSPDLESRLLSCDICSCPLFHRSTCPPGSRTLMFTAGPRIRKTSCCGCSERKSMWLLPVVLCPPFRWYPCDPAASSSVWPCSHSILLAEAGWRQSGLFQCLLGGFRPQNTSSAQFSASQYFDCSVFPVF